MKQHLGLDEYEGRTWGGFHRHLAMVILMHAFIALHRERISPRSPATTEPEPILSATTNGYAPWLDACPYYNQAPPPNLRRKLIKEY